MLDSTKTLAFCPSSGKNDQVSGSFGGAVSLALGVSCSGCLSHRRSNDIFELAVSQKGGNCHNVQTNVVQSISGAVDESTQRAAWNIGSDQTPVYEAGVANLIKDQPPMLVHTGDDQTRQVSLIRLPEPSL